MAWNTRTDNGVRLSRHPSYSGIHQLNREAEYRRHAAESMQLVARMADCGERRMLLALAQRWLHLAERNASLAREQGARIPEHPLVRKRLGPHQIGTD